MKKEEEMETINYSWSDDNGSMTIQGLNKKEIEDLQKLLKKQIVDRSEKEQESSFLDDIIGKRVLVWDQLKPGADDKKCWKMMKVEYFKVNDFSLPPKVYDVNFSSFLHLALIDGHEERLKLPYYQWSDHEDEV